MHNEDCGLINGEHGLTWCPLRQDSYVLNYFSNLTAYLSVGAPVYFVVKDGYKYTTISDQNGICGGRGCPQDSLLGQLYTASLLPN